MYAKKKGGGGAEASNRLSEGSERLDNELKDQDNGLVRQNAQAQSMELVRRLTMYGIQECEVGCGCLNSGALQPLC